MFLNPYVRVTVFYNTGWKHSYYNPYGYTLVIELQQIQNITSFVVSGDNVNNNNIRLIKTFNQYMERGQPLQPGTYSINMPGNILQRFTDSNGNITLLI